MKQNSLTTRPMPSARRAITLVESVISIMLVGVLMVSALDTVGAARLGQLKTGDRREGGFLAAQLMAEILEKEYREPGSKAASLGRDSGESGSTRTLYDDVDDYHLWSASPPQDAAGVVIPGMTGWSRYVTVDWVLLSDPQVIQGGNTDLKRITVAVEHDNRVVAKLVALKSAGLPPPDGSPVLLFVATNPGSPTAQESARIAIIESWNYAVTTIAASAPQSEFDNAVSKAVVAYVSEEIDAVNLSTKLYGATIGVVNEDAYMVREFGFSDGVLFYDPLTTVDITNNAHDITKSFAIGKLTVCTSSQPLVYLGPLGAPGRTGLATLSTNKDALYVVETGAGLSAGTAAGRRVQLPWGFDPFDFNSLTADALTIMKESIAWASGTSAGGAAGCGDATCGAGEDACNCPGDCGLPAATEIADVTCGDGLDNDCDAATDCADGDCDDDAACIAATLCGNTVCDDDEDCNSCSQDCSSVKTGDPSGWYCCGDGTLAPAEGDETICDGNP